MTTRPPALSLAARTYARYALPFVALAVIAFAPLWLLAMRASNGAIDVTRARAELRLAWELLAVAWIFQLGLVAAVAPAMRAIVADAPLSQARALTAGVRNLARAIVPCAIVVGCLAISGLALVVPALVVFPLVALTGASRELGAALPAPVVDSVAVARRRWRPVAAVAFGSIAVQVAIVALVQKLVIPVLSAQPSNAELLRFNTFLRIAIAAIVIVAPLPAAALAALYERGR